MRLCLKMRQNRQTASNWLQLTGGYHIPARGRGYTEPEAAWALLPSSLPWWAMVSSGGKECSFLQARKRAVIHSVLVVECPSQFPTRQFAVALGNSGTGELMPTPQMWRAVERMPGTPAVKPVTVQERMHELVLQGKWCNSEGKVTATRRGVRLTIASQ